MWNGWEQSEIKLLNQMNDLGTFGKTIDAPNNTIFLRPQFKYAININGTHRSRHCYDGFKITALIMIELNLTYSYYVEHLFQRLLLYIDDHLDLHI